MISKFNMDREVNTLMRTSYLAMSLQLCRITLPEGSGEGDNGVEASSYLSKETIGKAQGSDEFCQQIIHSLNTEEDMPYFLDQN
jgi:hypothetical protein